MRRASTLPVLLVLACRPHGDGRGPADPPATPAGTATTPAATTEDDTATNDARILAAMREIEDKAAAARARWTPELEATARTLMQTRWHSTAEAMRAIVASPHRQPDSPSRDPWRHPAQTLEFFGLTPTMHVFEVGPGGGWWTEMLAPLLAAQGQLSLAVYEATDQDAARTQYRARTVAALLASAPVLYDRIARVPNRGLSLDMGPDDSLDMVLVMRMTQNYMLGGGLEPFLAEAHAALHEGGVLAIEQHRAPASMTEPVHPELGYLPEAWLIAQVEAAGFELEAKSEINANPKDTKDHPQGVWSLPPVFADGEATRAKYEAIGESDRMTLKFVKPRRRG